MATLAESLVPSSSRQLPIRVRPDLEAKRQRYQGRQYWVVKDPVALQYFRFEEEEFAILQMLDGESSLEDISEQFERDFPPQTIRVEELQNFIGMLHKSNLVIADTGGQGVQLKKRRDERQKKERMAMATNVLSLRFKGFDPEWLLNAIYPWTSWFFTTTALLACIALCMSAATLVLVNFDVFQSKLPSFQTFFSDRTVGMWLLMGVVLGCTKILHEFGHGLSCKHFGGECHEMGVMFLVLTPCLYCNVSDSWMLPNRWHRAAIGAAGMYVEVVLASICTFIWWFTEPGLLNYTCLNIMFVSSVSTVMFNANPLLRYDGYYILSDLMEIPNLRQKASKILSSKLGKWCLGLEEVEDPFLPKKNQVLFAIFTVASAVYRWVVMLSILYFLNQVLEPYGLQILGQIIGLSAVWGLVGQPLWKLYKYFAVPGRLHKVKRLRMLASFAIAGAVLAAVLTVPLPTAVFCPVEIKALEAATVYVEAPGVLEEIFVEPGQQVSQGDKLARLSNIDNEVAIVRLEGQIREYESQIEDLDQLTFTLDGADAQRAQVAELLAAAEEQLVQQQKDADRLLLKAPQAGTVIPPTYHESPTPDESVLPSWEGSPLDERNLGATLEPATRFCQIGDPQRLYASLAIEQTDEAFVKVGQRVEVLLNQTAETIYVGKIRNRSTEEMKTTPPRLSSLSGGPLPTQPDANGQPRPLTPHFEAEVTLEASQLMSEEARAAHDLLRVGLTGTAKIHIAPRTLGQRLWTYLSRTFNFDL